MVVELLGPAFPDMGTTASCRSYEGGNVQRAQERACGLLDVVVQVLHMVLKWKA